MSDSDSEDQTELDSADAFSLLGDDTRIEILAALDNASDTYTPFSKLQDQVGLRDSGQFNYHLSKLVGHFVSKTEDGYRLTPAGTRLARAVAAGLYTDSPELPSFEVDGTCIECDRRTLEAAYTDEQFTITCRACNHRLIRIDAPPSLVRGRSPEEALEAFEAWSLREVEQALDGICPLCGGMVHKGLTHETPEHLPFDVLPEITCTVCGRHIITSFAAVALEDASVEAFLDRHNPNLLNQYYWEQPEYVSNERLELLSESPFRMQVSFKTDGRICEAVIDASLEVVRTTVRKTDG